MRMFGLPDQSVGSIVAAIIAGTIALLGLIISKEQKVSEFRQQWIDALRADIAAFIAHVHGLHGESLVQHPPEQALWVRAKEHFIPLAEASARIRLRLNPKEKESVALLDVLDEIESVFNSPNPEFHTIAALTDKLVAAAQVVLKQEWVRVRSGELIYRIARWVALLVIVALVAALLYHVFRK
jgi:hypothetical protein